MGKMLGRIASYLACVLVGALAVYLWHRSEDRANRGAADSQQDEEQWSRQQFEAWGRTYSLRLPPTWNHHKMQGIDSACGRLLGGLDGLVIEYDIAGLAGQYVRPEKEKDSLWFGSGEADGLRYYAAIERRGFSRRLAVTFPEAGPANFYVCMPDDEAIDRVLAILKTLRVASSEAQGAGASSTAQPTDGSGRGDAE